MRACKVSKAPDGAENQLLGYMVVSEDKDAKGFQTVLGKVRRIKLNELVLVLDEDDDECTYGITISKDHAPVTQITNWSSGL